MSYRYTNIFIILAAFLAAIALTASFIAIQGPTGYQLSEPGPNMIILRPDGTGDHTDLRDHPSSGPNWQKVDEVSSDGDSTYVYEDKVYSLSGEYDLYEFENAPGNGNITSVTVFMKCRKQYSMVDARVKAVIKTHGNTYQGSYDQVTTSYADYNETFSINPYTGHAWSWAEINNIQAGPKIYRPSSSDLLCTQVWIEVIYQEEASECNLTEVWEKLDELEDRINATEQQIAELNESFTNFSNWTSLNITAIWIKLESVQTELGYINDTLNTYWAWTLSNFTDIQDQIDDLQDDVSDLYSITDDLSNRVSQLENDVYGMSIFTPDGRNAMFQIVNGICDSYCTRDTCPGAKFSPPPCWWRGYIWGKAGPYNDYCKRSCTLRDFCTAAEDFFGPSFPLDMSIRDVQFFSQILGLDDETHLNLIMDACKEMKMWDMLIYGFHDIITSTRIETYYNPTVEDPISFVVAVPRMGMPIYRIAVAGTGPTGPCYQVLRWGRFIPSNTLTNFVDEIKFGQSGYGNWGFTDLGTYRLRLIIQRPWWPLNPSRLMLPSQEFEIDVVALESFIENSTITITHPIINSNNLSSQQNVSWQQSGLMWMNAILGENTPGEDDFCDVYYYSNLNNNLGSIIEYLVRLPMYSGNASKYCQGDMLTTEMDNGNQGIYKVCAEAEFIASYDAQDCINIGIDDLAPIIYGIWPGENDAINGRKFFYVDVSDDNSSGTWSGVESVSLEFINKTGFSVGIQTLDYQYGQVWGAWVNTTDIPDNYYTFKANATDAAGNTAVYSIDPIIDNTPPVINSITLSSTKPSSDPGNLFYRGYPITITANITDNLAGVNASSVYATVDSTNVILTRTDTNLYSGTYTTTFNEPLGSRTVTVHASDLATNNVSSSTGFNFTYSYSVILELGPSSINKGNTGTAEGTVTYDNGTLVNNKTVIIALPWDGNITGDIVNGTFLVRYEANGDEGDHTITAFVTADNGEVFRDTALLTITRRVSGGGGGGGCREEWQLISCTECQPDGTKICTYEDKGTCRRKGTKTETESCVYVAPEKVPEEVYIPAAAEEPIIVKPAARRLWIWIAVIAGILAITATIITYARIRRKKTSKRK